MYPEGAPHSADEYKKTTMVALVVFKSLDLDWLTSVITKQPLVTSQLHTEMEYYISHSNSCSNTSSRSLPHMLHMSCVVVCEQSFWSKMWFWREVVEDIPLGPENFRILHPEIIHKTGQVLRKYALKQGNVSEEHALF